MTLRERLSGAAVGGWCMLPGPAVAELMGSIGFDFVCVDMQHGLIGYESMVPMLAALQATDSAAVVRVPWNEPSVLMKALDAGAEGVIVPMVDTAAQAERAVAACHYPPRGNRSYGPTRLTWTGLTDPQASEDRVVCAVMIETREAVLNLDAILAVPGVDAVFVGPADLALSAGVAVGAEDDPEFDRLLCTIAGACRDRSVPAGIYCPTPAHVQRFRGFGFRFAALGAEASILHRAASDQLARCRELLGGT